MTKLCARGKAAAKRKFAVYPSAYANAYASKICAGKIKDPSGKKRKDFKGPKPSGKKAGGSASSSGVRRLAVSKAVKPTLKKDGGYIGSHIKSEVGGKYVSNKSYEDYYKDLI